MQDPTMFVHILQSQRNGRFYVGQTARRRSMPGVSQCELFESTQESRPVDPGLCRAYPDRGAATRREKQIKDGKERRMIEQLIHAFR